VAVDVTLSVCMHIYLFIYITTVYKYEALYMFYKMLSEAVFAAVNVMAAVCRYIHVCI